MFYFQSLTRLVVLSISVCLFGCAAGASQATPPPTIAGYPALPEPTVTPGVYPPPWPTPVILEATATYPPLPTVPTLPTPLPTPVITPWPTAGAPIIPLSPGQVSEPFTIIFRREDSLWEVESDGRNEHLLVDVHAQLGLFLAGPGVRIYQWGSPSPDGSQLALVLSSAKELEKGLIVQITIYLFDLQTGELRLLVEDGEQPIWSPDGTKLAYRHSETAGLWIVEIATGVTQEIYAVDQQREYVVRDLSWSPDSQELLFLEASLLESANIVVAKASAPGFTRVLTSSVTYRPSFPWWSPDGGKISFVSPSGDYSEPSMHYNLWIMNPDGTEQIQLTKDIEIISGGYPGWSPDGRWIAFVGIPAYEETELFAELWLINPYGLELKRLTSNAAERVYESDVLWSPDGTQLIFEKDSEEVWVLNLANGEQRGLPSITPDFIVLP